MIFFYLILTDNIVCSVPFMELWCVVKEIFKRHNMYGLKFSSGTRLIEDQYQSQKTKYTLFQFMEIKRLISLYTYKKMLYTELMICEGSKKRTAMNKQLQILQLRRHNSTMVKGTVLFLCGHHEVYYWLDWFFPTLMIIRNFISPLSFFVV